MKNSKLKSKRLTTKVVYNYIVPSNVENIEQLCYNKLGQHEDIEDRLGLDISMYVELMQNGFYGYVEDDDHDEPYIFYFEPRSFTLDDKLITTYWEVSGEVYNEYKLSSYGKLWALTREELENV